LCCMSSLLKHLRPRPRHWGFSTSIDRLLPYFLVVTPKLLLFSFQEQSMVLFSFHGESQLVRSLSCMGNQGACLLSIGVRCRFL
jgi:hypothetical protein